MIGGSPLSSLNLNTLPVLDSVTVVGMDLEDMLFQDTSWIGEVAIVSVIAFAIIVVLGMLLSRNALSGRKRLREVEAERDQALRQVESLQTRVDSLERRVDRRQELESELGSWDRQAQQLGLDRSTSCLLYTSPSPRDRQKSRMPSSA